jgi:osmotically-inducible protein OsmY
MSANKATLRSVRTALAAENRIDLLHHPISLSFDDGVLTMEGQVRDVAAKKRALARAASVEDVHHIVDRLRVEPARQMSDAEIRDHLCDALLAEPALQGGVLRARLGHELRVLREPPGARWSLEVSVAKGVVTLDGELPSLTHKRIAGLLAWWVPGSRDVVNGVEVVPPEEDSDEEISDAVRIALEKDPLVDAGQLHVTTRGALVTLDGVVASPDQREMAESDVWYVFGVDHVVNRITVRA